MEDHKTLGEQLARAELNVEKGRAHVERQKRVIAELESVGTASESDIQLLKHREDSLEFLERHRASLTAYVKELGSSN